MKLPEVSARGPTSIAQYMPLAWVAICSSASAASTQPMTKMIVSNRLT